MSANDANELNAKGNTLFGSGEYQEAIKCYDEAIDKDPNHVWALRNKGVALSRLGRLDKAIEHYEKAIAIDQSYVDPWYDKGNALLDLGKFPEAISCFDRVLELDPTKAIAWDGRGVAFRNLGRYDDAIVCFEKALEIDPSDAGAWYSKASVLDRLEKRDVAVKHYDKAIEFSTRAIELDQNPLYNWTIKGDSLSALEKYSEAADCFNQALKLEPNNPYARSRLFFIYGEYLLQYDEALRIARKDLEVRPDDISLKANLAELLVKLGSYEEGRKYALQVLAETQETKFQCVMRFLAISSYLLEENPSKANEEFEKFLKYYKNLDEDFRIESWSFRGLISAISKSNANLQTKFLILALIDLLQGKIDRNNLSFFRAV